MLDIEYKLVLDGKYLLNNKEMQKLELQLIMQKIQVMLIVLLLIF